MRFDFATAGRILFGAGTATQVGSIASEFGSRALLVTGASADRAKFAAEAIASTPLRVKGEPTVETVEAGVRLYHASQCDLVIAVGGGSVIDAGKAIAALAANPGEVLDYIEVVGRGQTLTEPSVPFLAVPTTAGTGSEVTRNAVIGSKKDGVKASLRSPFLLPRVAVVDPGLTIGLPPAITASTGLDALTQLIEPYVSVRRNPMVDLYCREGIRRVAKSLRRAFSLPSDLDARTNMSFASLLGGLSLANAGLGVVHGFAAPVGGMFQAPHGAVCAALLPHAMEQNIRSLRDRAPADPALDRYREIAVELTGKSNAHAEDGVVWVRELCGDLEIPGLRTWGLDESYVPILVEKALQASSTKGNPIVLNQAEMTEVLAAAL